mmetsp:Transcript_31086/g.73897  ORF Transcript_31086/g.73897 Transcript_31086/m.73897 type:complete len:217 (+) Transcript_31086:959-1609(+)
MRCIDSDRLLQTLSWGLSWRGPRRGANSACMPCLRQKSKTMSGPRAGSLSSRATETVHPIEPAKLRKDLKPPRTAPLDFAGRNLTYRKDVQQSTNPNTCLRPCTETADAVQMPTSTSWNGDEGAGPAASGASAASSLDLPQRWQRRPAGTSARNDGIRSDERVLRRVCCPMWPKRACHTAGGAPRNRGSEGAAGSGGPAASAGSSTGGCSSTAPRR